jgi:hypothetical protein
MRTRRLDLQRALDDAVAAIKTTGNLPRKPLRMTWGQDIIVELAERIIAQLQQRIAARAAQTI